MGIQTLVAAFEPASSNYSCVPQLRIIFMAPFLLALTSGHSMATSAVIILLKRGYTRMFRYAGEMSAGRVELSSLLAFLTLPGGVAAAAAVLLICARLTSEANAIHFAEPRILPFFSSHPKKLFGTLLCVVARILTCSFSFLYLLSSTTMLSVTSCVSFDLKVALGLRGRRQ